MMDYFYKKIHPKIKSDSKLYWYAREWFTLSSIQLKRLFDRPFKRKIRVLFYYTGALGYGGTSSFMQVLAKHMDKEKYEVYLMYADQVVPGVGSFIRADTRLQYILDGGVVPIRFDYEQAEKSPPYFVHGMSPSIFKVIKAYNVDLLVATGAGHAEFPFSAIRDIPIILLNIFGQPNVQKNITYHVCISREVGSKLVPVVPANKIKVMPVPTEGPILGIEKQREKLRHEWGVADNDLVFGRIGRLSDDIFDPIAIYAFQKVVKRYPHAHYVIVGGADALKEIVRKENIPHVHFLPENGYKEWLWAFYFGIDVLAHYRRDGESFGLNIAEAMYAGKPVISHVSHVWNAHLEYLDNTFSRVAEADNVDQYAGFMELFAQDVGKEKIRQMGEAARQKAEKLFHIREHIGVFEQLIDDSLRRSLKKKKLTAN